MGIEPAIEHATPDTVLGLAASCAVGDVDSAARAVVARAAARSGGYACLCNVHVLTVALHDPALHDALACAWRRFPDGAPVAWLQRRIGHAAAERVGGPDLMPRVAELGSDVALRHFLLGSTHDVTRGVEEALTRQSPGVQFVGRHSPPFVASAESDAAAVDEIRAASPHIVWCALGAPKQELWMRRVAPQVAGVLFIGVGASFDFIAQTKRRAPRWMRDSGLEWLYRLGSEPTRLAGRYLRTNSEFMLRSGFELTRRRLA